MNTSDEKRHVIEGPKPQESVAGLEVVRFLAISKGSASDDLAKAKEVMLAWLNMPPDVVDVDDAEFLRSVLPSFFVERFAAEATPEEDEAFLAKWRNANAEQKQKLEDDRGWTISEWVHWMKSENRQWWWWNAGLGSEKYCAVAVVVEGWPFAWEALKVLLLYSGFDDVQPERK